MLVDFKYSDSILFLHIIARFEAMKAKWDTRGSKEYFDDDFNPVKKPLSDGTHMHALDIFAAGSMSIARLQFQSIFSVHLSNVL